MYGSSKARCDQPKTAVRARSPMNPRHTGTGPVPRGGWVGTNLAEKAMASRNRFDPFFAPWRQGLDPFVIVADQHFACLFGAAAVEGRLRVIFQRKLDQPGMRLATYSRGQVQR